MKKGNCLNGGLFIAYKLIEYLETYSDLLDLTYSGASGHGVSDISVN